MFLPTVGLSVRPWFEQYGATLDDAPSFRIQMDRAKKEIDKVEPLIGDFEKANFPDDARTLREEIEAAKALMASMQQRHDAILEARRHM